MYVFNMYVCMYAYMYARIRMYVCMYTGLPAVVTMSLAKWDKTYDDVPIGDACRRLEEAGADVVGLNCHRGPATMLPAITEVRRACKVGRRCLIENS